MVYPKNLVPRAGYLERGRSASKACVDFAVNNSFKVKCVKNWYRDISSCVLCTLKGVCMAKSPVDLDCSFQVWVLWPLQIYSWAYGN